MSTKFKSKLFYGKTGFFDSIAIGNENPSGNFYISGKDFRIDAGQAYFENRPIVNGSGVLLIGEVYEGATFSQASFDGTTSFSERPLVNGTGVVLTGDSSFYPASNPSGFITGVDLSSYVQNTQTGSFVTTSQTGAFYPASNPNGFITGVDLSSYVQNTQTGSFVTTSQTGAFYPASNPNGFITGVDLSSYVQNTQTGSFVTTSQTGAFYPASNPNGFITGVNSVELDELYNVSIQSPTNNQFLVLDSGAWKNKSISPSDIGAASISELNQLADALTSDVGSLIQSTDALWSGTVKNESADNIVIEKIRAISQSEYDALTSPNPNTIYFIL